MAKALYVGMPGQTNLELDAGGEPMQFLVSTLFGKPGPHLVEILSFPTDPETEMAAIFRQIGNGRYDLIICAKDVSNGVVHLLFGAMFFKSGMGKIWRATSEGGGYTPLSSAIERDDSS